jgi:hypothetical protein
MLKIIRSKKHAKLRWLWDPSEINGENPKNVRCEATKHFTNKKREYLKDKIKELKCTVRMRTPEACTLE